MNSNNLHFEPDMLFTLAGGRSVLEMQRLNIHTLEAATAFLKTYGFDVNLPETVERMWYYHRRSLVLLTERLGFEAVEIPEVLRDQKMLGDIRLLLLHASSRDEREKLLQKWSCAILRTMHVFVHAENDLFSSFAEEIQNQIITPIQQRITYVGAQHSPALIEKNIQGDEERIELMAFELKPLKTSSSSVIKLLAKPDAIAMRLFDKLGVRFVTKNIFDSFRVIRFLSQQSIISFPHIMPDQSSNNIYPVELFLKFCEEEVSKSLTSEEIEVRLMNLLRQSLSENKFLRKENQYSGSDYRFIKFISRQLIKVNGENGRGGFSFFYPFEVQILDQEGYLKTLSGPSEHAAYKERQMIAARKRLFPESI